MKLEHLLTNENTEIFFEDIQIVNSGDKLEYYIDPRTVRNGKGLNEVLPFAFLNGHYLYICPDCGQIHFSGTVGKIEPGCCLDIDCERHQYLKGEHYMIKRQPIIFEEGNV